MDGTSIETEGLRVVRIVAVFVAGVVVAVGGALIYSTERQLKHPVVVHRTIQPETPVAAPHPAEAPPSPVASSTEIPAAPSVSYATVPVPPPVAAVQEKRPPVSQAPVYHPAPAVPSAPAADDIAQNTAPLLISARPAVTEPSSPAGLANSSGAVQQPAPSQIAPWQQKKLPEAPQPHMVTLETGTPLTIRLGETVSTAQNRAGDTFRGTLESPIIRNGFLIAERGSIVLGRVAFAQRPHLLGGTADLGLTLVAINTTDGQLVHVSTSPWEQRGSHNGIKNTAKFAAGAAIGAVSGAVTGLARGAGMNSAVDGRSQAPPKIERGRTVLLPRGAELTFLLAAPLTMTERLSSR